MPPTEHSVQFDLVTFVDAAMADTLDFAALDSFIAFAKDAYDKHELNSKAFKLTEDGSYMSLLMNENQDTFAVLHSMNNLSKTLTQLSRLAEEGLSEARKELLPEVYRRGMYSLPFEIAAYIFELAHYADDNWPLLLVNRHFRNIVLRASELWTTVETDRNAQPFVERSASRLLRISMGDIAFPKNQFERCMNYIHPHIDRWKSFSLDSTDEESIDDLGSLVNIRLRSLRAAYEGKIFPALETLHVDYGRDVPLIAEEEHEQEQEQGQDQEVQIEEEAQHDQQVEQEQQDVQDVQEVGEEEDEEGIVLINGEDPNALIRSFFSSWIMPALRCVETTGFIPMLPSMCQGNLTCFRLTLYGLHFDNELTYDLREIVQFLRELRSLEEFSINLFLVQFFSFVEVVPVELPNLRSMTVDSTHVGTDNVVRPLLDALLAPNLQDLTIRAEEGTPVRAAKLFDAFFPTDAPRWPQLEALTCQITDTGETGFSEPNEESPLNVLCTRLPRIRHLTIEMAAAGPPKELALHKWYKEEDWNRQPPLRSLSLLNCILFDTSFILGLGKIINTPEFELLEIRDCPKINTEVVRKLLPEGKQLKCTEYAWGAEIHAFKIARQGRRRRYAPGSLGRLERFFANRNNEPGGTPVVHAA